MGGSPQELRIQAHTIVLSVVAYVGNRSPVVFTPPRDRDAWAVIRGYVYQIDRTIYRWLDLPPDQVLELERGEDVDLVGRLLTVDESTAIESRLLEQIKLRETNVTLRTAAALESLANFHEHRLANPAIDLRFCYLTNAKAGCEQFNPFPDRIPGVTLWERLRTAPANDGHQMPLVAQIKSFLATIARPDNVPEIVWNKWTSFLTTATAEKFLTFIRCFEFSTNQPDSDRLPPDLLAKIRSLGFARDDIEATCDT